MLKISSKLSIFLILIILLVQQAIIQDTLKSFVGYLTANYAFIIFIVSLPKNKISIIFRFIYAISITNITGSLIYYEELLTVAAYASILETNTSELIGYLSHFGLTKFLIFVCISVASIYLVLTVKIKCNVKLSYALLIISVSIPVCPFLVELSSGKVTKRDVYENKLNLYGFLNAKYRSLPIFNDIIRYLYYRNETSILLLEKSMILPPYINTQKDTQNEQKNKLFLIIGESATQENFQIYGYPIKNNPRLNQISKHDNNLHIIDKVISPASTTRESLKRMLTFSSTKNNVYGHHINIVDLLNINDYETVWLSTQNKIGQFDSLVGAISDSANTSEYVTGQPDMVLVDLVKKYIKYGKKQAFFIHTSGSHLPYKNYSIEGLMNIKKTESQHKEYDSTILMTDKVIANLITIANKQINSLMIYTSDHGEVVDVGHGFPYFSYDQYHIPLIIYSKNELITKSIDYYRDNKFQIFSTEYIPNLIATHVLGYSDNTKKMNINNLTYYSPDGKSLKYIGE